MQEVEEARACLKKAFCKMCVTVCGRFRSDEGAVAGYGNRIRVKSLAKWGVQIAGMIFQTRSNIFSAYFPEQTVYQQQVNLQMHSDSDHGISVLHELQLYH